MIERLLWSYVALLSVVAFAVCVYDKRQARRAGGRVRERTLLLLALLGGSPGLLGGMLVARHKVRKPSFLLRLFAVVGLQLALAWFLLVQRA